MSKQDCIFCKIVKGEAPSTMIKESNNFVAIKNISPVVPGHTLVIPKKHCVTLLDIPNNLGDELLKFTKDVASHLLDEKLGYGFNLVMNNLEVSGQVVMHAHIHVIPRKDDDGVKMIA